MVEGEGVRAQVVAGELFGKTSSVKTLSPLFYGDIQMRAGSTLVLPAEHEERAAYLATGSIEIEGRCSKAAAWSCSRRAGRCRSAR